MINIHILFQARNWLKETGNKRVLAEQVIDMFCVGYDLYELLSIHRVGGFMICLSYYVHIGWLYDLYGLLNIHRMTLQFFMGY